MRQVVARIDVDYRRPILFRPEPYAVETWVTRLGTSSYDLSCRIVDAPGGDDTVYSDAEVRLVAFDVATQRSRPLTEPSAGGWRARSGPRPWRSAGLLERVHHELRRVRDVVPELRVELGGRSASSRPARKCVSQCSLARGVTANGACRIRSRGCPRRSEYVVGPPQYCTRNSVKRSCARPEVLLGVDRAQHLVGRRHRVEPATILAIVG